MAAVRYLEFLEVRNKLPVRFRGPTCVIVPNFVLIGQTVADIWPFFDFSRWRQSAILDFQKL